MKGLITVIIVGILFVVGLQFVKKDDRNASTSDTKRDENTLEERTERVADSAVKTVRAVASYQSPAGDEEVGFVLGLDAEGVIVNATVEEMAENEMSKKKQAAFGAALPGAVVGKKLSELSDIDTVSGSALTTGAFNGSIESLKSQE